MTCPRNARQSQNIEFIFVTDEVSHAPISQ